MSERYDGGFRPRLSEDPAYWDALVARITDGAEPVLAELRDRQRWWNPLSRLAPVFGIGAVAAALAAVVVLPAGIEPVPQAQGTVFADVFDPGDPVGAAFVGDSTPDLASLLVARIGREP